MTALQQSQRAIIHMEAEQSVLMGGPRERIIRENNGVADVEWCM